MAESPQEPSRLGESAEGLVDVASWFTSLVGEQMVSVARALDSGSFDTNAAAASLARSAALPLLGWAALANKVLEAGGLITLPFYAQRTLMSDVFQAPSPWRNQPREVTIDDDPATFVNGFRKPLHASRVVPMRPPAVGVEARDLDVPPAGPLAFRASEADFVLVAVDVPPKCVGAYKGQATVTVTEPGPDAGSTELVEVWLVVP